MKLGAFVGICSVCGIALVGSAGCGDQGPGRSAAASPKNRVYNVQIEANTPAGLPPCNAHTGGETAMVMSTMTLYACISGTWVPIRCTSAIGGGGAYDSNTKSLLACTYNPDRGAAPWAQITL